MLVPPIAHVETIDRAALNEALLVWGHKMGPWTRPSYGREAFHGLYHHGNLVAVTAADSLIRERVAGFTRDQACELGRLCASRPDLCRAMLRLWREFIFPQLCQAHGWTWAVSYQDAVEHTGDLYRFDGWIKLGRSTSGTDLRRGARGRTKVIWGWSTDRAARAARKAA